MTNHKSPFHIVQTPILPNLGYTPYYQPGIILNEMPASKTKLDESNYEEEQFEEPDTTLKKQTTKKLPLKAKLANSRSL